ncbi:hypothetical protein RJ40_01730 [Methanofollis aquaemaris]|uniref:Uncharacterized protein n=1 Tax=Methanofollis aquaemaris TaxID=126734 RepID=A0A8A3S218_9EURY|nr:hypothetical protein [Methanofollis aquaemaris]QSZ66308.1 hypothetical protein RJ40_01730 [Methanofollis aquaemaris]
MLIIGIAFLLFVAYAGYGLYRESIDPSYSIHLFPVNESETEDGVIVHLTEEDFEKWPLLRKAVVESSSGAASDSEPEKIFDFRQRPRCERVGRQSFRSPDREPIVIIIAAPPEGISPALSCHPPTRGKVI